MTSRKTLLFPLFIAFTFITPTLVPDYGHAHKRIRRPNVRHIPFDKREIAGDISLPGLRTLKKFKHQPWLSGSSVAVLPGGKAIAVADTDNNAVVIADVKNGLVLKTVAVGRRPERLVVAPNGRVFVTNRAGRSVSIVDSVKGIEIGTISAGVEPFGLALSPNGATLLVVSSATGELIAFETTRFSELFRLKTPSRWPAAVAIHPDGKRAYVTHFFGKKVAEVNLESQSIKRILSLPSRATGLPGRLIGRPSRARTPNLALAVVVSPGGHRLFVNHTMVDTGASRGVVVSRGGYGMPPLRGEGPIVSTVSTFDIKTGRILRPTPRFDTSQRSVAHGTVNHRDKLAREISQPMAIAHDPVNARLLMVGMGSDRVLEMDTRFVDPITATLNSHQVGHAPKGVAISADGRFAFIHDSQSFEISVLTLTKNHAPMRTSSLRRKFAIGRDPLPAKAAKGRRLFTYALDRRTGGPNRFACASCHPDGRQDGLVWRVGAGPRQTMILTGRLSETGPFNWLGTHDGLDGNIVQTIKRLGGNGITKTEVSALTDYMTNYMPGLDNPARRPADFKQQQLVARGKELFHSTPVGCNSCHTSDSRFTDGLNHNVGTTSPMEIAIWNRQRLNSRPGGPPQNGLRPPVRRRHKHLQFPLNKPPLEPLHKPPISYNTPSLTHLWASAPFYHDGSMRTLRDVITRGNAKDQMGKTTHLPARDIDALVAYLLTL